MTCQRRVSRTANHHGYFSSRSRSLTDRTANIYEHAVSPDRSASRTTPAMIASSWDCTPDTPTPPTRWPCQTSATAPSTATRPIVATPGRLDTTSSSSLLSTPVSAELRAFWTAVSTLAGLAPSMRLKCTGKPASSTMAIVTFQTSLAARTSPAASAASHASRERQGRVLMSARLPRFPPKQNTQAQNEQNFAIAYQLAHTEAGRNKLIRLKIFAGRSLDSRSMAASAGWWHRTIAP